DGTLRLWNVATGQTLRTFTSHTPTGDTEPMWAELVAQAQGELDKGDNLFGEREPVIQLAHNPEPLAPVETDERIGYHRHPFSEGIKVLPDHTHRVWSMALSANGRLALSGSYDGTLRLWDVATGQELRSFTGHTGPLMAVAFSA